MVLRPPRDALDSAFYHGKPISPCKTTANTYITAHNVLDKEHRVTGMSAVHRTLILFLQDMEIVCGTAAMKYLAASYEVSKALFY